MWVQENGNVVDFSDPTQVWWRPGKKRLRIGLSTNDLYCQKLDSLTYIFAADSIGLSLLLFTQLSLEFEPCESKTASAKTEFYIDSRPTRGSISSYNIAGHISEVSEEIATQVTKNCRRRQPHSHWRPPPRGTPTYVCMHLIFSETRVESSAYNFVAACMVLSSFKFVQWAPKDASFLQQSAFWSFKVVQGHPLDWLSSLTPHPTQYRSFRRRSSQPITWLLLTRAIQGRWFWYQSKARMRFPISPSLWLWSYLDRFWDTATYLLKIAYFSYPSVIRRPRSLCSSWNFALKLTPGN